MSRQRSRSRGAPTDLPDGRTTLLILCLDSEEQSLTFQEGVLRGAGYDVLTHQSGEEALRCIAAVRPDLVLLDLALADMDARNFCSRLQESPNTASIPVVLLDPEAAPASGRTLVAGTVDNIAKPPGREELLQAVGRQIHAKARPKGTQGGPSLWRQLGSRSEFPRFKRLLLEALDLPFEKKRDLSDVGPNALYTVAGRLGIPNEQLVRYVAAFLELPSVSRIIPEEVQTGILPASFCRQNFVVPLRQSEGIAFALSNPFDWQLVSSLATLGAGGKPPRLLVAAPETVASLFDRRESPMVSEGAAEDTMARILEQLRGRYADDKSAMHTEQDLGEESEPLVLLVNHIIEQAHRLGVSDIHIEPGEGEVIIRYRLDGELKIVNRFSPRELIRPVVSRLKVMSGLDISERRLPQDGRIVFKDFSHGQVDFDLRVSTAPMNFGEKVVMRIVDKRKSVLPLTELGLSRRHLDVYRDRIRTPYGMILHVGPTGSGKSMTLYAALNEMRRPEINIQTAEDPIEYTLPGINQLQIRSSIGLTFHRALRSFLRQDPDVILVGEIRDLETAEIATEAALTGHLVLSTLHTNDAASTVTRLIQMGIESFMVSSSIVLICAQRLLRRLCPGCKEAHGRDNDEPVPGPAPARSPIYYPTGCGHCSGIGYKGRIGIHEILVPDDAIRTLINEKGVTSERLKRVAVERCGMTTLYWDAMEKVLDGITSIQEVLSRVRVDEFDARPDWISEDAAESCRQSTEMLSIR